MSRAIELAGVRKNYGGLRPLRVNTLQVGPGERVAMSGLDAAAAELFVNLVTGAALPDEGTVRAFGRATADIASGDEWLTTLDQFGIVSPRAALLEGATVEQNLAMPFTLQIDPIPADVLDRVRGLAVECGLDAAVLQARAGELPGVARVRVHLARAVALAPKLLILEHPTADVAESDRRPLARDVAAVAEVRRLAAIAITMDLEFAEGMAHRALALQAATGELVPWKRTSWWRR